MKRTTVVISPFTHLSIFIVQNYRKKEESTGVLGKVSKTPGTETFRWGGIPPPGPPRTRFCRKVSGKKLTEKGGPPPPLHGRSVSENGNFFAENGVFCPKNTVFGPIFNGFFLNGKGGYPPSPLSGLWPAKKLAEIS